MKPCLLSGLYFHVNVFQTERDTCRKSAKTGARLRASGQVLGKKRQGQGGKGQPVCKGLGLGLDVVGGVKLGRGAVTPYYRSVWRPRGGLTGGERLWGRER